MKHPALISLDEVLQKVGEVEKELHNLSISRDNLTEEWAMLLDEVIAHMTLWTAMRSRTVELLAKRQCDTANPERKRT